jgi:undecaprenyl-diphosphatase
MDLVLLGKALVLGVVEGLTEFLPVSSTGHLILAADLLGFDGEQAKTFNLAIQTGAMLAVVWEYRARFLGVLAGLGSDGAARRFVANLVVAFIPAAVLGLIFGGFIKAHLFAAVPVATAFILGALVILWVERKAHRWHVESVDDMT